MARLVLVRKTLMKINFVNIKTNSPQRRPIRTQTKEELNSLPARQERHRYKATRAGKSRYKDENDHKPEPRYDDFPRCLCVCPIHFLPSFC